MWERTILLLLISLTFAVSCLQKLAIALNVWRLINFSQLFEPPRQLLFVNDILFNSLQNWRDVTVRGPNTSIPVDNFCGLDVLRLFVPT